MHRDQEPPGGLSQVSPRWPDSQGPSLSPARPAEYVQRIQGWRRTESSSVRPRRSEGLGSTSDLDWALYAMQLGSVDEMTLRVLAVPRECTECEVCRFKDKRRLSMRLDSLDPEGTEAVQKGMGESKSCLGGKLGVDRGRQ